MPWAGLTSDCGCEPCPVEEIVLKEVERAAEGFLAVYPDNSFRVVPFRPEIERYGGPDLYRASLDLFTLSSVAALELLLQQENAPRAARLGAAFRLLLLQALGFAMDDAEPADLLRYGVDSMGETMPKILEKGDAVAQAQRDRFLQLFRASLAEARGGPSGTATGLLVAGSGGLSAAIGFTDRVARAWIGGSHLHMTASRLGLGNVEEVCVSRLLTATLAEVRAADFSQGRGDEVKSRFGRSRLDAPQGIGGECRVGGQFGCGSGHEPQETELPLLRAPQGSRGGEGGDPGEGFLREAGPSQGHATEEAAILHQRQDVAPLASELALVKVAERAVELAQPPFELHDALRQVR
jgi:hypothetical protein